MCLEFLLGGAPVVQDLAHDDGVTGSGHYIVGDDGGVARLLQGGEDAGCGAQEEETEGDDGELPGVAILQVGVALDKLSTQTQHTHTYTRLLHMHANYIVRLKADQIL